MWKCFYGGDFMSLEVQINGNKGFYDNKISDSSVKYGRNSVSNHIEYLHEPIANGVYTTAPILDFSPTAEAQENNIKSLEEFVQSNDKYLESLPPLNYEYRYVPKFTDGNINKKALLGAAYEEMGTVELPVEKFEKLYLPSSDMTAKPMDINKDGNIDIAEYGANMIAADVLSKNTTDITKADGSMNSTGMNAILEYTKKANAQAAVNLYNNIYTSYNLGSAINEFKPE